MPTLSTGACLAAGLLQASEEAAHLALPCPGSDPARGDQEGPGSLQAPLPLQGLSGVFG